MRARWMSVGLAVAVFIFGGAARASDIPIDAFFGSYEGSTLFPQNEIKARELRVIIRPYGDGGFTVRWRTLIFKPQQETAQRTQVIYFQPSTTNPKIYVATPVEEAAGEASDSPLDGRPFAWARVLGDTLTINVMTIDDIGDYVVQTYDRTLVGTDMALSFVRVRNGEVEKRVWGDLERVEE